jgi:membrane-associated HD superfamily phosphohydrolase
MKKGILAGVGLAVLLGGGIFGINSVFADSNQTQTVQAPQQHVGKRVNFLNQHKDQVHQLNQLREERLDLTKQLVQKRDQLLDLFLAAKTSKNKDQLKQAKAVRPQIKTLNQDLKNLQKEARSEQKSLKQAVKNGESGDQITQLISTHQQINAKIKDKLAQLDNLISILSTKAGV